MSDPETSQAADPPAWLTVKEAAAYLRVTERHIYRAYLGGDLRSARPASGGIVRFRQEWLDDYVDATPKAKARLNRAAS